MVKFEERGQLNAFHLKHISSDTRLEINLKDIARKLGIKTTNAAKRLLVTSEGELLPMLRYGTKMQRDEAIKNARRISSNLYETTIDGKTIKFAASFGDEVPERIGSATVLEEFDGSVVDDLTRVRVRGLQKKAYESGVGYYDDDLLMMETFGPGTRFVRNRGMNPANIEYDITSKVKQDNILLKEAKELGVDDRRDINNMLKQLIQGGNPGIGKRPVGEKLSHIMEARARDGARIYYRVIYKENKKPIIEIVAYSNKNNQPEVIRRLELLYGK